ncbi:MAG: enoyl-CoA hydratase/isomerase family protein [Flavobacteriaceae bacterium]
MKYKSGKVKVQQEGAVLYLTLNNPAKLNPLDLEVMDEINTCLDESVSDDGVNVLVIRGEGRSFCAGQNVNQGHNWFLEGKAGTYLQGWREKMQKMRHYPKTIIFQVQGWCVGGAVELALCGDFIICADDAKFMLPQVNIGIAAMLEGAILPQAVGIMRAKRIVMTGEPVEGAEAARIGLASESVPADRLEARVKELAESMAAKLPAAIATQKDIVHGWMTTDLESSIEHSVLAICKHMTNDSVMDSMRKIAGDYEHP